MRAEIQICDLVIVPDFDEPHLRIASFALKGSINFLSKLEWSLVLQEEDGGERMVDWTEVAAKDSKAGRFKFGHNMDGIAWLHVRAFMTDSPTAVAFVRKQVAFVSYDDVITSGDGAGGGGMHSVSRRGGRAGHAKRGGRGGRGGGRFGGRGAGATALSTPEKTVIIEDHEGAATGEGGGESSGSSTSRDGERYHTSECYDYASDDSATRSNMMMTRPATTGHVTRRKKRSISPFRPHKHLIHNGFCKIW